MKTQPILPTVGRTAAVTAAGLVILLAGGAVPSAAAPEESSSGGSAPVTALVLIDIQEFYFPGGGLPLAAPETASVNAGRVLARVRANGWPVIHVRHEAKAGMAIHADVAPLPGETVITKREVNAFVGTDLLERLRALGVRKLVLAGMQTHMCLEAATRAAADLGFACTVVADACATRDLVWEGRTVAAADVHAATLATLRAYAEVTDAETWLAP